MQFNITKSGGNTSNEDEVRDLRYNDRLWTSELTRVIPAVFRRQICETKRIKKGGTINADM